MSDFPCIRKDLVYQRDARNPHVFIIKDPILNNYFQLDTYQFEIFKLMNGRRSLEAIARTMLERHDVEIGLRDLKVFTLSLAKQYFLDAHSYETIAPSLAARVATQTLKRFRECGVVVPSEGDRSPALSHVAQGIEFLKVHDIKQAGKSFASAVEIDGMSSIAQNANTIFRQNFVRGIGRVTTEWPIYSLGNPTRFLGALYRLIPFVFQPWFWVLLGIFILLGGIGFVFEPDRYVRQMLAQMHFLQWDAAKWFVTILAYLSIAAFHETGHGLVCYHFGGRPTAMGYMFMYYMIPAAFCEVSDAYFFREMRHRVHTLLAGIYAETMIFAIALPMWLITEQSSLINHVFFMLVSLTGFNSLRNLSPILKLDGYYILCQLNSVKELEHHAWNLAIEWYLKLREQIQNRVWVAPCLFIVLTTLFMPLAYAAARGHLIVILVTMYLVLQGFVVFLFYVSFKAARPKEQIIKLYTLIMLSNRSIMPFLMFALLYKTAISLVGGYGILWLSVGCIVFTLSLFNRLKSHLLPQGAALRTRFVAHLVVGGAIVGAVVFFVLTNVTWHDELRGDVRVTYNVKSSVRAEEPGVLKRFFVEPNAPIKEGAIVVRLENRSLEKDRDVATERLKACRAELALLKAGRVQEEALAIRREVELVDVIKRTAQRQRERAESLQGVIPTEEILAQRSMTTLSERLSQQKREVSRVRLTADPLYVERLENECRFLTTQLEQLETRLAKLAIHARHQSVMQLDDRTVLLGKWFNAGETLFELVDPKSLTVEFFPHEEPPKQMAIDPDARVLFNTALGTAYRGRLATIDPTFRRCDQDGVLPFEHMRTLLTKAQVLDQQAACHPIRLGTVAFSEPLPSWLKAGVDGKATIVVGETTLLQVFLKPLRRLLSVEFWKIT